MDIITNDEHNIGDILNLLHTIHPTHPDGTSSLWMMDLGSTTICIPKFSNITMVEFQNMNRLQSSTPLHVDRKANPLHGHQGYRIRYTFESKRYDVYYDWHIAENFVMDSQEKQYFHAGGWANYFDSKN